MFQNTLVIICTMFLKIRKLSILPYNVFLCFVIFPDQHRLIDRVSFLRDRKLNFNFQLVKVFKTLNCDDGDRLGHVV